MTDNVVGGHTLELTPVVLGGLSTYRVVPPLLTGYRYPWRVPRGSVVLDSSPRTHPRSVTPNPVQTSQDHQDPPESLVGLRKGPLSSLGEGD